MKRNSLFIQIILLVVLTFICIRATFAVALLAGSVEMSIFDFKSLNVSNMIPVFIFGGLITIFTIAITLLFTSRTLFYKIIDLFDLNGKENK